MPGRASIIDFSTPSIDARVAVPSAPAAMPPAGSAAPRRFGAPSAPPDDFPDTLP